MNTLLNAFEAFKAIENNIEACKAVNIPVSLAPTMQEETKEQYHNRFDMFWKNANVETLEKRIGEVSAKLHLISVSGDVVCGVVFQKLNNQKAIKTITSGENALKFKAQF